MEINVEIRQAMEKGIVRRVLTDALEAHHETYVNDGERITAVTSVKQGMDILFNLDDAHLMLGSPEGDTGWVYFVFGNYGYDVISDYSTNLEDFLKPANALADEYDNSRFKAIEDAVIERANESPAFKKRLLKILNKKAA